MSNVRGSAYPAREKPARRHSRFARTPRALFRALGVTTMFVALAVIASFSMARLYRATSSEEGRVASSNNTGVGKVVVETNKQNCEVLKFDNYSGRTIESSKRCQNTAVLDAKGVPVPLGTVHRLDSISKSFSGADR
jgi:hypothetical protein